MGTTLEWIESAKLLGLAAAEGWPQTLTPHKAACLQTWRKGMERRAHRLETNTWRQLIDLAVAAGEIEHTSTTQLVQDDDSLFRPIPLTGAPLARRIDGFRFADGKVRYRTEPSAVTHRHITAHAFSAWLAAKGYDPSALAAAWFKAQIVGAAGSPAETIPQRNARWLLVWDKISPTHADGSQALAARSIAGAEGVKFDTVKAGLQRARKARDDGFRKTGATPFKPAKNTANNPFGALPPKAKAGR